MARGGPGAQPKRGRRRGGESRAAHLFSSVPSDAPQWLAAVQATLERLGDPAAFSAAGHAPEPAAAAAAAAATPHPPLGGARQSGSPRPPANIGGGGGEGRALAADAALRRSLSADVSEVLWLAGRIELLGRELAGKAQPLALRVSHCLRV